jgi:phosphoribosylaminoimidazolecarboxamide formyltransferase/IMP cyclohydrolase
LAEAHQIQGKELSYNNYLDLDAAWNAVREFKKPTCVIVKHQTPCGIAEGKTVVSAYAAAWRVDPTSAYGGVMAFNEKVTLGVIRAAFGHNHFVEAIIAPCYTVSALKLLNEKPGIRVLATSVSWLDPNPSMECRSISGGILALEPDRVSESPATFTVPTKRQPTAAECQQLLFAWRCAKSVKSNAIVIAKKNTMIGAGAGQPNRVNSAKLAVAQAGAKARGAVAASDAFMPFADSLEVLVTAGVTAVIQPGGSIRDEEVIAAADAAGVALVFTGRRHFRH